MLDEMTHKQEVLNGLQEELKQIERDILLIKQKMDVNSEHYKKGYINGFRDIQTLRVEHQIVDAELQMVINQIRKAGDY